jgi:hypothetical protein
MLLPFVLFATIWADLTRPVSKAEWDRYSLDQEDCGKLPGLAGGSFLWLRSRVLAAAIKPGMALDDVNEILGRSCSLSGGGKWGPMDATFSPLWVTVTFERPKGRIEDRPPGVVRSVHVTPFATVLGEIVFAHYIAPNYTTMDPR